MLVEQDTMGLPDKNGVNVYHTFLEIYKVQFIAACKTKLKADLIVAFYFGENKEDLEGYVIGGLPTIYVNDRHPLRIVDYKGYLEICELTGESKLSFLDYYNKQNSDSGIGSILVYNSESLNRDRQLDLYKEMGIG